MGLYNYFNKSQFDIMSFYYICCPEYVFWPHVLTICISCWDNICQTIAYKCFSYYYLNVDKCLLVGLKYYLLKCLYNLKWNCYLHTVSLYYREPDIPIDVVTVHPRMPTTYDVNKAKSIMKETEKQLNSLKDDKHDNWEDKLNRFVYHYSIIWLTSQLTDQMTGFQRTHRRSQHCHYRRRTEWEQFRLFK